MGAGSIETDPLDPEIFVLNFVTGSEGSNNSGLLNISLKPEFAYFISEKAGLLLKVGGLHYNSYDFEEHEWKVSINPALWDYGFFLRFGKKELPR